MKPRTDAPGLFPDRPCEVAFGPSRFRPFAEPPESRAVRARREDRLRQRVRDHAPRLPGVYGMFDPRGRLLYIGKAKSLRSRLMSYFRDSRDPKAGKIIARTRTLMWEHAPSEFAALLRELELIRRHRPGYNVLGQPGRQRFCYVCVGRSPAPYVFVARRTTGSEQAVYGPVPSAGRAGEAARRLNDWFRLRDCSQRQKMHFADQAELFDAPRTAGCLRYEINTCLGPCAGGCTRDAYAAQVRDVRRFLDGSDTTLLDAVRGQMEGAAAAMAFEKAAALRDRYQAMQWLADQLGWLRSARDTHSFVYPVAGLEGRPLWYVIRRGRVELTLPEPATPEARRSAARLMRDAYTRPVTDGTALPPGEVDSILLVAGWFRRHADERALLLSPAEALARCESAGGA